ncbi:uncharacterized protein OCT59_024280 [Rhizophagus irregularis]|uniref:uncharacterized protein n=1 Tax=Rhizophagus irregularis TaxID=588596 RepID=UPI00332EC673|nr:hypothetical protein OCT59_024280 [Rhizophagus irregularis]
MHLMQDTENMNNWFEEKTIITKTDIVENTQFSSNQEFNNEETLSINNSKLQVKSSQLIIQYFDKINLKEIDPITVLNKREKLSFEKGFDIIVDETNNLIFKLLSKGIGWQSLEDQVIDYFNNHNINLQEIYNWLLYYQNDSNSIFLFGYFNYRGIGTNVNKKKAFNLFIDESKKNHILAQHFTRDCYEYGNGTIKSKKLAIEYYEKVANKNFPYGQFETGYCYFHGIGTKKDLKKAFYWYDKAVNNGNIVAMYNLGHCYKEGLGIKKDNNKAFELFKQSAEGEYPSGITMLGYCYGEENMIAQFLLGVMYEYGEGITKDIGKAIYWYKKFSKKGYQSAQNKLLKLQNINNL